MLYKIVARYVLMRANMNNTECRLFFIGTIVDLNNDGEFDGKQSYAVRQ